MYIVRSVAVEVNILRGYLTVCGKLRYQLVACEEASLAVGDRHGIYVADLRQSEPRGFVRGDAGAHDSRLVARYGVKGERRAVLVRVDYFSVGDKTELYQCLEAVADSAHETIPVFDQVGNSLFYRGISEERRDEFAASVGLIAAGEASGDEYHLRGAKLVCKFFDAAADAVRAEVVYNYYLGLCARVADCLCAVIFAVCAGECRNEHARLCGLYGGSLALRDLIGEVLRALAGVFYVAAVDALKLVLVCSEKLRKRYALAAEAYQAAVVRMTEKRADFLCARRQAQE